MNKGVWDSLNVIDIKTETTGSKNRLVYKITSTVILDITISNEDVGEVVLSGNLTKQVEKDINKLC